MSKAPERIWAQDAEPSECNYIGGGWWDEQCETVQYAHMVEYVRADLYEELEAKLAKAVEALEHLVYLQSGNPATGIQADNWLKDARVTRAELKGNKE